MGAALCPHDGSDFDELFEKADIALYHAKETGRSKYVFFTDKMPKISADLSFPIDEISMQNKRVYIRTFGYFDVFIDGKAILIQHAKAKELLALLVDRRGGFVTSRDIIAGLWENEDADKVTLARCRKVFMLLNETLKAYRIDDILESNKGSRRIKPEMVNCDLYNYLSGLKEFSHLYKGVYMQNYSWGELTIADLEYHTI
jgi:two-component SAPR family response regulator